MMWMIGTWALVVFPALLYGYRNELVFGVRCRAIDEVFLEADDADIERYLGRGRWDEYGYGRMVFDLRKWTFKQFYPELHERIEARKRGELA